MASVLELRTGRPLQRVRTDNAADSAENAVVQVLRLESHVILSNRTGVPLQVMQYSSAATMQPLSQAAIGVEPATGPGLPRGQPGQNYPPGLKGAIVDQSVDWTTCMELPAGKLLHTFISCPRTFLC